MRTRAAARGEGGRGFDRRASKRRLRLCGEPPGAAGFSACFTADPAASGMQMSHDMPMSRLAPRRQAVELRIGLEELLGQDAFVGIRVIRSRLRDDPDFTQAAVSALSATPMT